MTASNKDVVVAFVDAFARGDIDRALSFLAADAVIDEADGLEFSGRYHGPGGFRTLLGLLGARLAATVDSCDFLVADDGTVISKLALTFSSHATGRALPTRVTELYTVQNARITHLDSFYKDPVGVAALYAEN